VGVAEQRMVLLRDGELVEKYPISTSKFGLGDAFGSYRTPLGRMRVCEKYGDGLPLGAVLKGRHATGEILPVNAPGRDPIVTRILWLEGTEPHNRNARPRGIYIHGTPEEVRLGQPVSWGCIRMRSSDVAALFDLVPIGTPVVITEERLPRVPRYRPDRTLLAAYNTGPGLITSLTRSEARSASRQRITSEMLESLGTPVPKARGSIARSMSGSILLAGLAAEQPREDEIEHDHFTMEDLVEPDALIVSSLLDTPAAVPLALATGVEENDRLDGFATTLLEVSAPPADLLETNAHQVEPASESPTPVALLEEAIY
ncbi:MAG: L,D-transpeptidase family protein, partial [Chthoniobacteraceae bacterium]